MNELFLNVLILTAAIAVLVRAGDAVVRALIFFANLFGISEYVASFVLMSFATTLPELSIALNSAFSGEPTLAVGTAIGSNMVNIGFILGLVAVFSGRVAIDRVVASRDAWITFALGISPVLLLLDLELSRFDGLLLLLFFFVYLMHLLKLYEFLKSGGILLPAFRERLRAENLRGFFGHFFRFAVGAAAIIIAAYFAVQSGHFISLAIGLPELLMGILVFAVGTSLPELSFGLRAAFTGHGGLSLGNLIGASVFNSTLVLGLTAVISPISFGADSKIIVSILAMTALLFLANVLMRTRDSLNRREGFLLLAVYGLFLLFLF